MSETTRRRRAKPEAPAEAGLAAFNRWFDDAMLPLADYLHGCASAEERQSARDRYMADRGLAYAAWQAGREQQRRQLSAALREIAAGIVRAIRDEVGQEEFARAGASVSRYLARQLKQVK